MVSSVQVPEPVSRTDQYKRVMKPLLERKRRARINRCLDELRDLLVAALQQQGETVTRLEKADILELTVRHVRRLNDNNRRPLNTQNDALKFQQGFVAAAQQVQNFLISTSALEPQTSTRLLTHLSNCASTILPQPPSPPPGLSAASVSSSVGAHPPAQAVSHPQGPPPPPPPSSVVVTTGVSPNHIQSTSQVQYPQRVNPQLPPQVVIPKSSPPSLSPPPLIDLRIKPEPYVPPTSSHHIVMPTPIREAPPVSGPQDLSIRRPIIKEEPHKPHQSIEAKHHLPESRLKDLSYQQEANTTKAKEHHNMRAPIRVHPYDPRIHNRPQAHPEERNGQNAQNKEGKDAWRPW